MLIDKIKPVYGYENDTSLIANFNVVCEVYNDATSTWEEVLGASTRVSSIRGGNVGVAGLTSVEVGTFSINILDTSLNGQYDPAQIALLRPNQPIRCYIDDSSVFADPPTDGAIFTGHIQDIATNYFYQPGTQTQYVNVTIYAADAVSSHAGITVTTGVVDNGTAKEPGFIGTTFNGTADTAAGYQRWEDRINDLSTGFAASSTPVPTVVINSPDPIYSI